MQRSVYVAQGCTFAHADCRVVIALVLKMPGTKSRPEPWQPV